jgi:hypothetical protein
MSERQKVAIETDEAGRLTSVAYDGDRVNEFHLTRTGLTFSVKAQDDSIAEIRMTSIVMLTTGAMREKLVAQDIHIWKAFEAPLPVWQALEKDRVDDDSLAGIFGRYFPQYAEFYMVYVVSSYGEGFTCLCQRVEVFYTPKP